MSALTEVNPGVDAQRAAFRADVLAGLASAPKAVPSRWLYDDRGSDLFEAITAEPEYYPTRTETAILTDHADAIADFIGPGAQVVEYGAGAGIKIEILLAALAAPALYVPIDIAGDFVRQSAARIAERFPGIAVRPVTADFTADFVLPSGLIGEGPRCAFFPGSTIGNIVPAAQTALLARMRRHMGESGTALIGMDLRKDVDRLIAAYDDAAGATARFEMNLLARMNRELGADFDPDRFVYEARWNAKEAAVDMLLVSREAQTVTVAGERFGFRAGEAIHTESSRKYDRAGIDALARSGGWTVEAVWTDPDDLFAVVALAAR